MAKAKVENVELQDKQEKVSLDAKKIYVFESNGTCGYMPKGKYEITGELVEIFTKQGYGKVC